MAKQTTVDEYIQALAEEPRAVVEKVRGVLRKALPKAEESISYGIPALKIDGRAVIYFAGWKKHWSLYPVTPPVREQLGTSLDGYELSKGTVKFPLDKVPVGLIQKIAKVLAKNAAERAKAR